MKPILLVLAAGMGSRYGGMKQLDAVGPSGETIMEYTVFDALNAGFGKVVFVIREDMESEFQKQILDRFEHRTNTAVVFQELNLGEQYDLPLINREKPWGTGHAVLTAEPEIDAPFAMVNADDFYGQEALELMADFLINRADANTYCMVSYSLSRTLSDHGTVSRGVCTTEDDKLQDIDECAGIEKSDDRIVCQKESGGSESLHPDTPVSMNLWGMHPSIFHFMKQQFREFLKKHGEEQETEFYLPSVISSLLKRNEVEVQVLPTEAQWYGVTYFEDKASVREAIHKMVENGVYPNALWKGQNAE